MKTIKVHFHRKFYSWWNPIKYTTSIIKLFSNDIFYHVSFEIEGTIYSQKKIYESDCKNGVGKYANPRADVAYTVPLKINEQAYNKIVNDYNLMVGSKYDFFGVLFGFFGYKIHNARKYFCSELFLPILKHAYGITKKDLRTNLSPKDVRMICLGLIVKNTYSKTAF